MENKKETTGIVVAKNAEITLPTKLNQDEILDIKTFGQLETYLISTESKANIKTLSFIRRFANINNFVLNEITNGFSINVELTQEDKDAITKEFKHITVKDEYTIVHFIYDRYSFIGKSFSLNEDSKRLANQEITAAKAIIYSQLKDENSLLEQKAKIIVECDKKIKEFVEEETTKIELNFNNESSSLLISNIINNNDDKIARRIVERIYDWRHTELPELKNTIENNISESYISRYVNSYLVKKFSKEITTFLTKNITKQIDYLVKSNIDNY